MSINLIEGKFSTDYFALREDHQPVCTDQFLHGLQVLAGQAALAINKPKAVEQAFERIQEAKWELKSSEAKNDVDQKIQDVRQKWVKVCFGEQFLHVPREHLEKNCGPKFHAQYISKMKEATEPKLELLPPEGVTAEKYDKTIVKAFLDYIQTGTLSEGALNASILDLLSLAHQHQIEGLITKCTEFLKEQFEDHENLDTIWEVANKQNIPQLTFACLSYVQANQDKISKELKRKCEKTLPVVRALFKNEILLKKSPSGNVEVRIKIFNEETASHIEQLRKLFTIRSLVISERRTDNLLNNSEKLFPFLTEISPMLKKDLKELIIWNETPKDNDFLTLRDLYPNLTALGNDAPFLKNFEEVKTYLNSFTNPDENDQESEKLVLRSLNLSFLFTLDDVQMEEFTPHLLELYHIYIKSDKIISVVAPKATKIHCGSCTALTTLKAPKAIKIYCGGCKSLTTLEAPKATEISCRGCKSLTTLKAREATEINCTNCTSLTTLKAREATEINCTNCTSLTTIKAPKVTEISSYGCTALTTIKAPKATEIFSYGCTALTTLNAPKATKINCQHCTALTTLKAPKATKIFCGGCTALTTLKAPIAIKIYCGGCIALTTLAAPKATKIYFGSCTALTILNAPKATKISSFCCTALTTIEAPKATNIYCAKCTSLTILNAPKTAKINCSFCTAITTLEAPEAIEVRCYGCTSLTTLKAPKATKIYCRGCTALTTLKAPKAIKIYCGGCTALTTLEAPNATKIT